MSIKVFLVVGFLGVVRAGLPIAPAAYSAAPAVSYSSISAPIAAAPLAYSAPIAKIAAPAPISYAAPIAKVAAPIAYAAPVAKAVVAEEYDPNPQYSYAYEIQDGLTGDSKSQHESRSGDVVQGSYSLIDPDGTRRTVDYSADPVNGFNAVVHKEPLVAKVAKIAAPAPIAYAAAAPSIAKIAAPISYAAPAIASYGYAAPAAKIAAPVGYAAHYY